MQFRPEGILLVPTSRLLTLAQMESLEAAPSLSSVAPVLLARQDRWKADLSCSWNVRLYKYLPGTKEPDAKPCGLDLPSASGAPKQISHPRAMVSPSPLTRRSHGMMSRHLSNAFCTGKTCGIADSDSATRKAVRRHYSVETQHGYGND